MNLINPDFKDIVNKAIDAYSHVYGEKYASIIRDRISNAIIIPFYDYKELDNYLNYLLKCKENEYTVEFLSDIHEDVSSYRKDNYTCGLDKEVEDLKSKYIYSMSLSSDGLPVFSPISLFFSSEDWNNDELEDLQIQLVNHLLGNKHNVVTKENFEDFKKTKDYNDILNKLRYVLSVCNLYSNKLKHFDSTLDSYHQYIKDEEERESKIHFNYKIELYNKVKDLLPRSTIKLLKGKTDVEKAETIFGSGRFFDKTYIEYFSKECFDILLSSDNSRFLRSSVAWKQAVYFEKLGVLSSDTRNKLLDRSDGDIDNFIKFTESESFKQLIPSDDVINVITQERIKAEEKAKSFFQSTRTDYVNALSTFVNGVSFSKYMMDLMLSKQTCISTNNVSNHNTDFGSIIFYSLNSGFFGELFHVLLHEFDHVINHTQNGVGFESNYEFLDTAKTNPYDELLKRPFRIHERFNETLTDMFSLEAEDYLHGKKVYLIEDYEFTKPDRGNVNTSKLLKNILAPLLDKYRDYVVMSKIYADSLILINKIGYVNYEALVNAVNYVDLLCRKGLELKLKSSPDDEIVTNYKSTLEEVEHIYQNIDKYVNRGNTRTKK